MYTHWFVSGNLYWTDHGFNLIEVARLSGLFRAVVISEGLDQPKAIAVHPMKGYCMCICSPIKKYIYKNIETDMKNLTSCMKPRF